MLIHCKIHCLTWTMLVNSNAMTTQVWFKSQVSGKVPSEEPPPQMGINHFGVGVRVCVNACWDGLEVDQNCTSLNSCFVKWFCFACLRILHLQNMIPVLNCSP